MTPATTMALSPRTVYVEHCMGTAFTIDIRDADFAPDAVHDVVTWLHHVDAVFSTYRPDSDISRMRRGELRAVDAHPDVLTVLELCAQVQTVTRGYFTALRDRVLDPTGLVKGWAVERASARLRQHGSHNHAVNGGGDLQLAGLASPGRPWRVGIADPHEPARVLTVVTGHDFAVATSGTSERGRHIVDPFTGRPSTRYASATVFGPSLTHADAYATAAFVMGAKALAWAQTVPAYEILLIDQDGGAQRSAGWRGAEGAVGHPAPGPGADPAPPIDRLAPV